MMGAATLVPSRGCHPACGKLLEYTAAWYASAATSATVRVLHPWSVCQTGLASSWLQPLSVHCHAVSDHCLCGSFDSCVPPAAVTYCDDAGHSTVPEYPTSPELATMGMPAWAKIES